jgi:hypothetical protein
MDRPPNEPAYPHVLILAQGETEQEFQLTGGPLEDLMGERTIMAHIGRAVLAWARMEQHLNLLIMTINREHNSPVLYERKHPQQFTEMLRVANVWFSGHPALKEWKDDFAQFSAYLEELSGARNTLAHGILFDLDKQERRAIFKTVKRAKGGKFRIDRKEISFNVFPRMIVMANAANTFLSVITHQVCCPEGEELLLWRESQNSETQ